jgi:hypothetical protein
MRDPVPKELDRRRDPASSTNGEVSILPTAPRRCAVVLGFELLLIGCVSLRPKHEYELSPGRAFNPGMKSALVLPINETVELPTGLDKGEREVFALLVSSLEAEGLQVQTLDAPEYRRVLAPATRAAEEESFSVHSGSASESVGFSRILPRLLSELGAAPDLVVVPNMVMRVAEASGGRSARWDGVKRLKPGANPGWKFTGTEHAASLWVVIYARDGTKIFSGYGGLDLLFEVNVREEKMQLWEDRLEDVDQLRQGVCVALYPFFGEDRSCRGGW